MKFIDLKNFKSIKNLKVGLIGYGIQGRACALNLRDNRIKVHVHQIKDKYLKDLKKDKFKNYDIRNLVEKCEVIIILVPDASHKDITNKIARYTKTQKKLIVLPSGFACTFEKIKNTKNIKFFLISPRYPGQIIRQNYLNKVDTLGFYGSVDRSTTDEKNKILTVAKAWGMKKLFVTTMKEEANIDLFIENFLIPRIMGTIEETYNAMIKSGIQDHIAMLEAYQSGEIIGLFQKGLSMGMFNSFHKHTSPTCQFAVSDKYNLINKNAPKITKSIINEIKNKKFYFKLKKQLQNSYKSKNQFNKKKLNSKFTKTQRKLINFFSNNKIIY